MLLTNNCVLETGTAIRGNLLIKGFKGKWLTYQEIDELIQIMDASNASSEKP